MGSSTQAKGATMPHNDACGCAFCVHHQLLGARLVKNVCGEANCTEPISGCATISSPQHHRNKIHPRTTIIIICLPACLCNEYPNSVATRGRECAFTYTTGANLDAGQLTLTFGCTPAARQS